MKADAVLSQRGLVHRLAALGASLPVVMVILAGVSHSVRAAQPESKLGGPIAWVDHELNALNPYVASAVIARSVISLTNRGLVSVNAKVAIVPILAIAPDNRRHLKHGVPTMSAARRAALIRSVSADQQSPEKAELLVIRPTRRGTGGYLQGCHPCWLLDGDLIQAT